MARSFSGNGSTATNYGNWPNPFVIVNFNGPSTVSQWVYLNTAPGATDAGYFGSGSGFEYSSSFSSSKASFGNCPGGGYNPFGTSTGTISTQVWTNVVYVFDTTTWAIYLAGAPSGSGSFSSTYGSAVANFTMGYNANTGNGTFNGALADFAIWNAKLTALEAAALGSGVRAGRIRRASLTHWAPLDGLQLPEPILAYGNVHGLAMIGSVPFAFGPPFMPFTPRWPQPLGPPPPDPMMTTPMVFM